MLVKPVIVNNVALFIKVAYVNIRGQPYFQLIF